MSESMSAKGASGIDRMGREILTAGHELWRAGLGAVSQIAEMAEIDELKRNLFDRLVERGRPLEERRRKAMRAAAERAGEKVREAGKLLEDTVRYEVKGVLTRIGVPTREQVNTLSARLETLSQKIDQLLPQTAKPAKSAAPKPLQQPAAKVGRPQLKKTTTPKATR